MACRWLATKLTPLDCEEGVAVRKGLNSKVSGDYFFSCLEEGGQSGEARRSNRYNSSVVDNLGKN